MANGTFEEIVKLGIQNRRPDLFRLLEKIGARPRGYAEIEIKRIKRDQGIYPREQTDWDRVEIYKEALEEGAVFPPVLVAAEPENLLLDGNHRLAAHEQGGHEKIWIERWDIPKHYLKLVAQAANTEYGQIDTPLTGKEKKRAIIQDWEDGIRDVNLIAEALKTTPNYVRKVLSQAGLIRDRKEEMKKRARELREEGLTYREIAKRLKEDFGKEVEHTTVIRWFKEDGAKITQVKNVTPTPTVRSVLDDPEKLARQEEAELLEAEKEAEYARYKDTDIPLATIEYWVGECRHYIETGSTPEEAVELAGVHPNVKKYVIEELKERFGKELEVQKWIEVCKPYIDAGFEPKEAVLEAKVPEELRVPVVKKLVGYKNRLYQEEEARFKAELGPVDSRRREIIMKAHNLVSLVQEIEQKLKELDAVFLRDAECQDEARYYGRDQYIRDYLTFILVRGGWEKAEWFREITKRWVQYTLHPVVAKDWIEDIKEQAKLTPEEWEKKSIKFWEEYLATEAKLKWKQFCEALGLPILKEYGGTE